MYMDIVFTWIGLKGDLRSYQIAYRSGSSYLKSMYTLAVLLIGNGKLIRTGGEIADILGSSSGAPIIEIGSSAAGGGNIDRTIVIIADWLKDSVDRYLCNLNVAGLLIRGDLCDLSAGVSDHSFGEYGRF